MFLSFPPPTKMFQFRGLAHLAMCQVFYLTGCPIQKSPDQILFANPRSFSQLTTSFFASKSLGIPHTPLFTWSDRRGSNPRSRPWQGRALPTTPLSHLLLSITVSCEQIIIYYGRARLSTHILKFLFFFQMYLLFPKIP